MTLEGRVAIVTGASRGIGADIALELGRAGVSVVVAARSEIEPDPRLPGTIHSVAAAIEADGGTALPVRADLSEPADLEDLVAKTLQRFGRIDILVNNAAVSGGGNIDQLSPRRMELLWSLDLRAPIRLIQLVLPHMREQGGGHIVNISSVAAVREVGPAPYVDERAGSSLLYGPLKRALNGFSELLARDLWFEGSKVSVNVLSPMGRVKTPGNLLLGNDPDDPVTDFEAAEAMAKVARWICEQPPEFTGHVLWDETACEEQGL